MEKVKNFILNHFDFKLRPVVLIAFIAALALVPCLLFMPQKYGVENGVLENTQMAVLFLMLFLCLKPKYNKRFFKFVSLIVLILMIREVNCFRTIFFPIPGEYHKYYSWKQLPNPWLGKVAHGLYGTYIAIVALLFLWKKHVVEAWEITKKVRFPFWNVSIATFSMVMGAIAEKATNNNMVFEEGFELLFYICLLGMVWLYTRNKDYALEDLENSQPQ